MTLPARKRPTPDELERARGSVIPDLIAPGLHALICGINPSLYSAVVGYHFARPGNRFWPAIYSAGITPRLLRPDEQHELLALGYGITNVVERATARADELSPDEFIAGGARLAARVAHYRPATLAVLGVSAYRAAFGRPRAEVGPQPDAIGGAPVWVLPNPSGLNAHYSLDALARAYRDFHAFAAGLNASPPKRASAPPKQAPSPPKPSPPKQASAPPKQAPAPPKQALAPSKRAPAPLEQASAPPKRAPATLKQAPAPPKRASATLKQAPAPASEPRAPAPRAPARARAAPGPRSGAPPR